MVSVTINIAANAGRRASSKRPVIIVASLPGKL
jgi:hypothetical protein